MALFVIPSDPAAPFVRILLVISHMSSSCVTSLMVFGFDLKMFSMVESTSCLCIWSKSSSSGSMKVSWRKSAIMLETICGSLVSCPSPILSVVGRELFFLDESIELISFSLVLSKCISIYSA